jgi:hypothetical protein
MGPTTLSLIGFITSTMAVHSWLILVVLGWIQGPSQANPSLPIALSLELRSQLSKCVPVFQDYSVGGMEVWSYSIFFHLVQRKAT